MLALEFGLGSTLVSSLLLLELRDMGSWHYRVVLFYTMWLAYLRNLAYEAEKLSVIVCMHTSLNIMDWNYFVL